tara:strand:+ start:481 stop:705 length:225 start_codon:yes stop_codon:yes gene_type:complete
MGKSQKIAKLLGEKQKIEKKIEELQRSCEHPTKSVKFTRERLDSTIMVIRYVCDECLLSIGYPTQQEIKKYLNG